MATVGLCMIVKNEAHVIERCLASVRPVIDHWCIVDTGSEDDTRERITAALAGIPGELHNRPWRNFGHNRTEALVLARPHADYTLVMDADDMLVVPHGFRWPDLTHDAYSLLVQHSSVQHWRTTLVSNRLPWRYVGVLHEYLDTDGPFRQGQVRGPTVLVVGGGGRSQGITVAEKYARDARILEEALREEPGNTRYQFYLAQSYRDCGELDKAIAAYEIRATMGGWVEEVWYALYQAAVLRIAAGAVAEAVVAAHLRAFETRPQRAEALCSLAAYMRQLNRWPLAHLFAKRALETPKPADLLFLEDAVYSWRSLDEYAIAAYWVGDYRASADACRRLLSSQATPEHERTRIEQNLAYARTMMPGAA